MADMLAGQTLIFKIGDSLPKKLILFLKAGTISLCRTFDIVFAYLWQFIFLGVVPDMFRFGFFVKKTKVNLIESKNLI